jgi:hypothetical protein
LKLSATHSLFAIFLLAAACSSQVETSRVANPNRYVYVTSENLSEQCYRDLGPINLTEPFAQATVEAGDSTLADRLRALALKEYPQDGDAVIGVSVNNNDAGTATTVSGEVVAVEDHTTAACMLRDMPPVLDGAAQTAAGGMLGTLVGGLVAGTPQAAEGGGYLGATTAGSIATITHHENQQQQIEYTHDTLVQQQRTIVSLQQERARMNECREEETPLTQCRSAQPNLNTTATADTPDAPNLSSSQFDLEKQIQMQQDYIVKLNAQIGDIKQEMQSP